MNMLYMKVNAVESISKAKVYMCHSKKYKVDMKYMFSMVHAAKLKKHSQKRAFFKKNEQCGIKQ